MWASCCQGTTAQCIRVLLTPRDWVSLYRNPDNQYDFSVPCLSISVGWCKSLSLPAPQDQRHCIGPDSECRFCLHHKFCQSALKPSEVHLPSSLRQECEISVALLIILPIIDKVRRVFDSTRWVTESALQLGYCWESLQNSSKVPEWWTSLLSTVWASSSLWWFCPCIRW